MFPKALDGATVLYFTEKGNYGKILYTTGEVAAYIHYLAICKYENDNAYYLFDCDSHFEVVGDSVWNSIEECMSVAASSHEEHSIAWLQSV